MKKSRRRFIIQSAFAASAVSLRLDSPAKKSALVKNEFQATDKEALKVFIFSKMLHWLNWSDMAAAVREMGFDGVDLTVRPDGHVLPERVAEDLPKAVEVIRKQGLVVDMITTAITSASDQYTAPILKTASELGIKNYRLGWFLYNKKITITDNFSVFKKELHQLEQLNKKYAIHGGYQNHAGEYFGAAVLDLWTVLKDLDPQWIGCQYDIRHATAEGVYSWPTGFSLLHDYIKTINLKDFEWVKKDGKWQEENKPLGTGMVNFKHYFTLLKEQQYNGSVCVHCEYNLGGAENGAKTITMPKEEVLKMIKNDLIACKQLYAEG